MSRIHSKMQILLNFFFVVIFFLAESEGGVDRPRPLPPPGFKPQSLSETVQQPHGADEMKKENDNFASPSPRRQKLSPEEAQEKIFGKRADDKTDDTQKRVKQLEKVRDLISEYNELVKQKAEKQTPNEPMSEELKAQWKMMQSEVAAAENVRAKKNDPKRKSIEELNAHLEGYLIDVCLISLF